MIDEKWSKAEQVRLWYKPEDIQRVRESELTRNIHRRLKKIFKTVTVEINRLLSWRWLLVSPSQIVERYRRQFDKLGGRSVPQGGIQP
jgi:hypothetical protein